MTLEDWYQTQEADPESSHQYTEKWNAGKRPVQGDRPPKVSQFGPEWNHLVLKMGILYR